METMKRSVLVTLGLFAATALAACSPAPEDSDNTQICVDEETGRRVEDEKCDEGHASHGRWYYGSSAHPAPAVGQPVDKAFFSTSRPGGVTAKVPRGGFGGRGSGGAGS